MTLTREQLITALSANVCQVTFTKLNGEVRVMPCTLREDLVPKYERKTPLVESQDPVEVKAPSPTLSVWCTDKAAWRSFRVDSVTNVEIEMEVPNA
jgi:hypothetical protein